MFTWHLQKFQDPNSGCHVCAEHTSTTELSHQIVHLLLIKYHNLSVSENAKLVAYTMSTWTRVVVLIKLLRSGRGLGAESVQ